MLRKKFVTNIDKKREKTIFPPVMNAQPSLSDSHSRMVSYLRFSVTDRCNLHCLYCRGLNEEHVLPHDHLLTYEEILRLADIAWDLGIRKVRLTGGEPFARRDCTHLLLSLRERFPDLNLRITSNGTLIRPHLKSLKEARINAVNLSIDSFDRATFARITGRDLLCAVLDVLEELLSLGIRVKINAVAMKGITDVQLPSFLKAIERWPVDVRFIEFMPMGSGTLWQETIFLSADELVQKLQSLSSLEAVRERHKDQGPAQMYTVDGCKGRIGIISALSHHFCDSCNRLRITSDGNLRTCLFADAMTPLRDLLRDPDVRNEDIATVIRNALATKPVGAELLKAKRAIAVAQGHMDSIGG